MTPACAAPLPSRRSSTSVSASQSVSAMTSTAAGSTRPTIRSAPPLRRATCASPRACARTISAMRCSRRCTRPATRSTSRASIRRSRARRSGIGASAGVHESQSRLWENVVGAQPRFLGALLSGPAAHVSRPAWQRAARTFYRAINKVERSLIRTDADEVTYNLHIMLRFELELAMLEGRLRVGDLPDAWRAAHAGRSRRGAARRPRRLPAGRALVRRQHRWRIPGLHHRQHSRARSSSRPR